MKRTRNDSLTHEHGQAYTDEERAFILEIERYKRKYRVRFLTCQDVLNVAKGMGYRKVAETSEPPRPRRM
jgi:hypothetical protein